MSIADTFETGDHVETLRAMGAKLAGEMDRADSAVVAQVAARLQAVLDRIAELDRPAKESEADDIADRVASLRLAHSDAS